MRPFDQPTRTSLIDHFVYNVRIMRPFDRPLGCMCVCVCVCVCGRKEGRKEEKKEMEMEMEMEMSECCEMGSQLT